ncbi:MAG: hypothetical protein J7J38_01315 [Candidatus Aenigmarchaeota archaeon]|nr:hypothetical protein [Candidatus Aenigmarchaeota archaeon]
MPTLGISFKSIQANVNRSAKPIGNISVNSAPIIKDIEEAKTGPAGIKNIITVQFEFKTIYEPNIGNISLSGELLYQTDKIKDILKEWKKNKRLPSEVAVPILNAIFRRCLSKIISLSEDLQLPPPIRFPVVKQKEGK